MARLRTALLCCSLLWPLSARTEINEGELQFLDRPPGQETHHHRKHITILPHSLKDGWVADRQCHENLDQVAAMEVVFGAGKVRRLRITRSEHIGASRVSENSIQMQDVGNRAVLCLESELRLLEPLPVTGHYLLRSGPYMRRFLDGYFPMRLTLTVDYPADRLRLVSLQPEQLRPVSRLQPGTLRLDSYFEGIMEVILQFEEIGPDQR